MQSIICMDTEFLPFPNVALILYIYYIYLPDDTLILVWDILISMLLVYTSI